MCMNRHFPLITFKPLKTGDLIFAESLQKNHQGMPTSGHGSRKIQILTTPEGINHIRKFSAEQILGSTVQYLT